MGADAGPLDRVAAVVVTYRRPRLATTVVRSLLDDEGLAPKRIFLVVNGEGGLDDRELEERIHVIRLLDNVGPAGAFRAGMLSASREVDVDWIYLCEDDISLFDLPTPRIEKVVAHADAVDHPRERVGAVVAYGRDLHHLSGHTTVHRVTAPEGLEEVDAASWGATLVSRKVVDAGILPDDDYFFGYEDFDFFYRIQCAGFRLLVDRASVVAAGAHQSLSGRDAAFAGHRPTDTDEPWRAYYVARNYFILSRRHGSPTWILADLIYSARRLQRARSTGERTAISRGLIDGATGRTGKNPRFVRQLGEIEPSAAPSREIGQPAAPRRRLVLHLLPNDIARGGQVMARDLRDALDAPEEEHRILALFQSAPALLDPDYCLGLQMGPMRQRGFDPRVTVRLKRALELLRPAVVVAHGGEPLKYAALATDGRVPVVYLALGVVTDAARRGPRRLLYQTLMGRADVVAGISAETVEEAHRVFRVPKSRLVVLPNGRDPSIYRPARKRGASDGVFREVVLTFVGHLTSTKRPAHFVALVSELRRRGRPVRGLVVGDGPLEEEIRGIAEGTDVDVLGRRVDVADILRRSDVLVFTSVPESEGMPGVLIEAGLTGLPVVATATPGVSTVVKEGVTGHVVPFDDFEALVEKTERIVADADLRARMGRAARRHCELHFSTEVVHREWRTLLSSLAPCPGAPAAVGPAPTRIAATRRSERL